MKYVFVKSPKIFLLAEVRAVEYEKEEMDALQRALESRGATFKPGYTDDRTPYDFASLLPPESNPTGYSDAGSIIEFAGRNCYMSFGDNASPKTQKEYIAHTQSGENPHLSLLYQAHFNFYITGVSRNFAIEFIRHYVGSNGEEEGSISQMSSRYAIHPSRFVVPPKYHTTQFSESKHELGSLTIASDPDPYELREFKDSCKYSYKDYLRLAAKAKSQKGLERKKTLEAAASVLPGCVETSFVWSGNAQTLRKLFRERGDAAANAEFQAVVRTWKPILQKRHPSIPW